MKRINGKEAYKLLMEGRKVYTISAYSNSWCYEYIDGVLMFTKGENPHRYYSLLNKEDIEEINDWSIDEYYMMVNDVFHIDNVGKYYKTEYLNVVFHLVKNIEGDGLTLLVAEDNEGCYCIGACIENIMSLDDILHLKFKEIEFN